MASGQADKVVLDASAVLASLFQERGADVVNAAVPRAVISAVTVTEISTKLMRLGMPRLEARAVLESDFPCVVVPFDTEQAFIATSLWPQSRANNLANNLSLGDRACLALAIARGFPVLTADTKWAGVTVPVAIHQVRMHAE